MTDARAEKLGLGALGVGLFIGALGAGSGALSTPELIGMGVEPQGLTKLELGLWLMICGLFLLYAPPRGRSMALLTPLALVALYGANHLAFQEDSMAYAALGIGVFAAAGLFLAFVRPQHSTRRGPIVLVVVALVVGVFTATRTVPVQRTPIPGLLLPAERPE